MFPTLSAGNYAFTLTTYPNYSNSDKLSDGFAFDIETPIAIADWCQPESDACNDQKGTFWRVRLSGIDVAAVPEPGTYAMFGLGAALVVGFARRRSRA